MRPRVRAVVCNGCRYVDAMKRDNGSTAVDEGRVIAMSLHGSEPDDVWGVIRCAQLIGVHLPAWKLRVYVSPLRQLAVPDRVVTTLRGLGARVVKVPHELSSSLPPRYWRLMAADDTSVHYFLQRNADWRLGKREAASVGEWVAAAEESRLSKASFVVHCIRDHPKHSEHPLVAGLWGGRPRALRDLLNGSSLAKLAEIEYRSAGVDRAEQKLLESVVWPAVSTSAYCHDSVSPCDRWKPRHDIAVERQRQEYIGEPFNQHQVPAAIEEKRRIVKDVKCHD